MSDAVKLTREALYNLVWTKPMTKLAAEFGMSSVAFAKHVRQMAIPRPGRGYWQQLACGLKVKRDTLPKAKPGVPTETTITRHPPRPPRSPVSTTIPQVPVAATLSERHPVLQALRVQLKPNYRFAGMKSIRGRSHSVVKVSPEAEKRAILILVALFRSLEQRGHSVRFRLTNTWKPEAYSLEVAVGNEISVEFWLTEHLTRSEHELTGQERSRPEHQYFAPKYDLTPSGQLIIETERTWGTLLPYLWQDRKTRKLEDQLGEIVVSLEAAAKAKATAAVQHKHDEELRIEQRRLAAEKQRRTDWHRHLGDDLVRMATAWNHAKTIRLFLDAAAAQVPAPTRSTVFAEWLAWAEQYADAIDPLSIPEAIPKPVEPNGASDVT